MKSASLISKLFAANGAEDEVFAADAAVTDEDLLLKDAAAADDVLLARADVTVDEGLFVKEDAAADTGRLAETDLTDADASVGIGRFIIATVAALDG